MLSVFLLSCLVFFFFKQKTAYEMRISDWSSDVCSSDVGNRLVAPEPVDNSRVFETRKRLNDAILAEAGSIHDRVKTGEQRASAIVDDAGQELDDLDAGLSDSSVANARCGCPPLRERLPLVEFCGFDHLAHLARLADRCVSLGPLFGVLGDAAGPRSEEHTSELQSLMRT